MFHRMERTATERTAAAIRAEMARRQIGQQELAKHLGRSRQWLWRRLSGNHPIDLDELTWMADAIGVPTSALLPTKDAA